VKRKPGPRAGFVVDADKSRNPNTTMPKHPITRRDFLATSGKTAATLAASSAAFSIPHLARSQSAEDPIVLALIGAGGRAAGHASGMSRLQGVEFKYVCDVWKNRGAGIMQDLVNVQKRAPQRISDMRVALERKPGK
jgi:hypothetical protein